MDAKHSEDQEFLRKIRGRFQDSASNRWNETAILFLSGIIGPAFFLLLFCLDPERVRFFFAVMAVASFATSAILWRDREVEYEFTGEEIIEQRAGRIRNRMHISDIIETEVKTSPPHPQLRLKSISSNMTVHVLPPLDAAIQKVLAELMATKSEDERRQLEQFKLETKTRLKREKAIGTVISCIFALVVFAIMIFLAWFKQKH